MFTNNNLNTLNTSNATLATTNVNNVKNCNKLIINDLAEKEYNNMINEEFEKKILNPDILIKNSNKIFDNAEKRINSKSNK